MDNAEVERSSLRPTRPEFRIVGNLADGHRIALRTIEELFLVRFTGSNDVKTEENKDYLGQIVYLPNNLKMLDKSTVLLDKKAPNLILNVTESNKAVLSSLVNKNLPGRLIECQNYDITSTEKALGPLRGICIREKFSRDLVAFAPNTKIQTLISSNDGWVFGKSRNTYISSAGLPGIIGSYGLTDYFNDLNFMELLPLFVFLRKCLGIREFRPTEVRACCIIDDANLRLPRYGYMKYSDIVKSANHKNYCIAIGMIPIDYKKIGHEALAIFKENPKRLSIIMHGTSHLKNKMTSPTSKQKEKAILEEALCRMNAFAEQTGLKWTKAMVFPYDESSIDTIRLIRKTGFQGAFKQRACPSGMKYSKKTQNPLFEMFLANNTIEGFPVINRQSIEAHYSDHNWYHKILFYAWLGKPIIPWTHHYFFKHGLEELEERIGFINQHISPKWTDIGEVLSGNYTVAQRDGRLYTNLYSNVMKIEIPDDITEVVLTKHGQDLPGKEEMLIVNGSEYDWDSMSSNYSATLIRTNKEAVLHLEIIQQNVKLEGKEHAFNFRACARRYLTEFRDQTEPYLKWNDKFIRNRVFG